MMSALALVASFLAGPLFSPKTHAAPPKAPPPPIQLPSLPVLARITIDPTQAQDRVLVVHDFVLDRGEYHGGDLVLYAAYGGPAVPLAMDAHVFAGTPLPTFTTSGLAAIIEARPRRPDRIEWTVGRPSQAGAVIRVPAATLAKAWDGSSSLVLRVRAVHPTQRDANGDRDVIVRLGTVGNQPVTVSRIEVRGSPRAWARTCTKGALNDRLFLYNAETSRRLDQADISDPKTFYQRLDPSQLQRAPEQDLCITF